MNNNNHTGFTLAEVMISLGLASFLCLILMSLLLLSYKNLAIITAEQEIITQASQVELLLGSAIQQAGYLGCHTFSQQNIHQASTGKNIPSLDLAIIGFAGSNTAAHAFTNIDNTIIKPNTDIIIIRALQTNNSQLKNSMTSVDDPIVVLHKISLNKTEYAVISNCNHADAFAIEQNKNNNFSHPSLSYAYDKNARFGLLQNQTYFIKATTRFYFTHQPIYALYRKNQGEKIMELIPGISDMQIEYASKNNDFSPANKIANWKTVTKIKITFISETSALNKMYSQPFTLIISLKNQS